MVTVAVVGVLAGAAISVFAFLLARYGPEGAGWSFKGNGALAAYTLIPGFLAGGWTALVLRARSIPSWLTLGLAATAVGLLIAVADALLLPLFGPRADQTLGVFLLLALVAWMVVAPAVATAYPPGTALKTGIGTQIASDVVWLVAALVGLIAVGFLVPAGS